MEKFDCPNHCINLGHTQRYAITFGEVAVLHYGGNEIGTRLDSGYSVQELKEIGDKFGKYSTLHVLSDKLPENLRSGNEAAVLVIKNGANILLEDIYAKNKLFMEQQNEVIYDRKYWDPKKQKTFNKRARYNAVFGQQDVIHNENYSQCTVNGFPRLPNLSRLRDVLPYHFGDRAKALNAEGNWYYEEKSGIGYHGDRERKVVICLCLGTSTTVRFCVRYPKSSDNVLPTDINVEHGDIYIMSEKATGYDWLCRSKVRFVHSAGNSKYINK